MTMGLTVLMCAEEGMILADQTSHFVKTGQTLEESYRPLGHMLLIAKKITGGPTQSHPLLVECDFAMEPPEFWGHPTTMNSKL